jgi:hypothetical protein
LYVGRSLAFLLLLGHIFSPSSVRYHSLHYSLTCFGPFWPSSKAASLLLGLLNILYMFIVSLLGCLLVKTRLYICIKQHLTFK